MSSIKQSCHDLIVGLKDFRENYPENSIIRAALEIQYTVSALIETIGVSEIKTVKKEDKKKFSDNGKNENSSADKHTLRSKSHFRHALLFALKHNGPSHYIQLFNNILPNYVNFANRDFETLKGYGTFPTEKRGIKKIRNAYSGLKKNGFLNGVKSGGREHGVYSLSPVGDEYLEENISLFSVDQEWYDEKVSVIAEGRNLNISQMYEFINASLKEENKFAEINNYKQRTLHALDRMCIKLEI